MGKTELQLDITSALTNCKKSFLSVAHLRQFQVIQSSVQSIAIKTT